MWLRGLASVPTRMCPITGAALLRTLSWTRWINEEESLLENRLVVAKGRGDGEG